MVLLWLRCVLVLNINDMTEMFQPFYSLSTNVSVTVKPNDRYSPPCWYSISQAQLEQHGAQMKLRKPAPISCFLWFSCYCSDTEQDAAKDKQLQKQTKKLLSQTKVNKVFWRPSLFHFLVFRTNCPVKISIVSMSLKDNSRFLYSLRKFLKMQHAVQQFEASHTRLKDKEEK